MVCKSNERPARHRALHLCVLSRALSLSFWSAACVSSRARCRCVCGGDCCVRLVSRVAAFSAFSLCGARGAFVAMDLEEGPDLAGLEGYPGWVVFYQIVEMQSSKPGYEGAWFKVEIKNLQKIDGYYQAYLEHQEFHENDEPGSPPLREWAKVIDLRPLPPKRPKEAWKVGDCVETRWQGAWWVGYIKEVRPSINKYVVWYNDRVPTETMATENIRVGMKFEHKTVENPKAPTCWSKQRRMQNPPSWEKRKETQDETRGKMSKPKVQQPWVYYPAPHVEKSEDDEWRPKAKKSRVRNQPTKSRSAPPKSQGPPTKKIRVVKYPTTKTVTQALPAVNLSTKPSEQTTVCITPGSSPPLADSPYQDSAISLDTEPLANPEALPAARSSSSNSGSRASDTGSESSSSGEDDDSVGLGSDDDNDDDVGPRSEGGDGGEGLMSKQIFHDYAFENQRNKCMNAYRMLLSCFHSSSKGCLDENCNNILRLIREELGLTMERCQPVHCEFFGLGLP